MRHKCGAAMFVQYRRRGCVPPRAPRPAPQETAPTERCTSPSSRWHPGVSCASPTCKQRRKIAPIATSGSCPLLGVQNGESTAGKPYAAMSLMVARRACITDTDARPGSCSAGGSRAPFPGWMFWVRLCVTNRKTRYPEFRYDTHFRQHSIAI